MAPRLQKLSVDYWWFSVSITLDCHILDFGKFIWVTNLCCYFTHWLEKLWSMWIGKWLDLPCSKSPLAGVPDRCSSAWTRCFFYRVAGFSPSKETNNAKFHFNQDARATASWNSNVPPFLNKVQEFFPFCCFHVFHSLGEMITLNENGLHPLLISLAKINVPFFKKQKLTGEQVVIKRKQNYSSFQW